MYLKAVRVWPHTDWRSAALWMVSKAAFSIFLLVYMHLLVSSPTSCIRMRKIYPKLNIWGCLLLGGFWMSTHGIFCRMS